MMQPTRHFGACAAYLLLTLSGQLLRAQVADRTPTQEPPTDVAAIISGCRANRARIPFGRVKIIKTEGFAPSVDDAIARRWLDEAAALQLWPDWPPSRSECLWVFDGETSRFEDIVLPGQLQLQFGSPILVQNELFEIRMLPKKKDTRVSRVSRLFFQDHWNPFLKGNQMCAADHDVVAFDGASELDGRAVMAFSSRVVPESNNLNRYWVDPGRGFLPVRIEEADGRIYVFEDFVESGDGGWMPRRWVEVYPQRAEQPRRVAACEVTEWDFESSPGDDLFRVSVEAGETFGFNGEVYRIAGTEIDLRWFLGDGSVAAPENAVGLIPAAAAPVANNQEQFPMRYPPRSLDLVSILVISIATGFGALFLWDWLRRRRKGERRTL
jgi:hypothetical protein